MIVRKVDLYRYFSLPRPEKGEGWLTVYCRERYGDLVGHVRPAVLVIPGGGYEMVSAREGEPVAMNFLGEGYDAFVLEYTVNAAYPVPLIEGAMAMCYIRENAEEYGADPEHVCVIGFSAGGHLAGMLTTLFRDEAVVRALGDRKVRPDASLLSYAVLTTSQFTHEGSARTISGGDPALRKSLSLEERVTKDCPPVFLWHTFEDDCVPVENSLLFASALRKAGVPFELHVFEKGWHGTSVATAETEGNPAQLEKIGHLSAWFPLAVVWLKKRGFVLRTA